jgi:uncharacterized protein (TIGR04552 family)
VATETTEAPTPKAPGRLQDFDLADLESVRLLLRGSSVIDWHKLSFPDADAVDRFLRLSEFDPADEEDMARLEAIRTEAVDYLERGLSFRIPPEIAAGVSARELFLVASQKGRRRPYACVILKVMHIIHHLAGRELLTKLPIATGEVFQLVEAKVMNAVEQMRATGYPVVEFAWSRKNADSLVTKLLAKKESIAAHVYDKLRFRLITRTEADLMPVLRELTRRLIPFNYVIPGESQNTIIRFSRTVGSCPELAPISEQLQGGLDEGSLAVAPDTAGTLTLGTGPNEFSGPSYRVINFVADLPVKLRDYLAKRGHDDIDPELGDITFVLTEFQVVDATTAALNEQGENSHQLYKERQLARVRARLLQGEGRPDRGERADRTPGEVETQSASENSGNGNGNGHGHADSGNGGGAGGSGRGRVLR